MASGGWEGGQKAIHSFSTGYPQVIHRLSTGYAHIHRLSSGYPQVISLCDRPAALRPGAPPGGNPPLAAVYFA